MASAWQTPTGFRTSRFPQMGLHARLDRGEPAECRSSRTTGISKPQWRRPMATGFVIWPGRSATGQLNEWLSPRKSSISYWSEEWTLLGSFRPDSADEGRHQRVPDPRAKAGNGRQGRNGLGGGGRHCGAARIAITSFERNEPTGLWLSRLRPRTRKDAARRCTVGEPVAALQPLRDSCGPSRFGLCSSPACRTTKSSTFW